MPHAPVTSYSAVQLNDASERGWAVLELPSGAIANTAEGELIFRLTREEAEALAARMTADLLSRS